MDETDRKRHPALQRLHGQAGAVQYFSIKTIRNTVAKSGVDARAIKAIAISGLYGGSGIPLDKDMKPVRPCMIWMDRRAQRESDWVLQTIGEQQLLEITHNGADPYYGYTKMPWMKHNEPENRAKTKLFLPPNAYVTYRLTGEIAIDYSSAGNIGGIFDMNTRTWSLKLLEAMSIPAKMMPRRLVESTDIVGTHRMALSLSRQGTVLLFCRRCNGRSDCKMVPQQPVRAGTPGRAGGRPQRLRRTEQTGRRDPGGQRRIDRPALFYGRTQPCLEFRCQRHHRGTLPDPH